MRKVCERLQRTIFLPNTRAFEKFETPRKKWREPAVQGDSRDTRAQRANQMLRAPSDVRPRESNKRSQPNWVDPEMQK